MKQKVSPARRRKLDNDPHVQYLKMLQGEVASISKIISTIILDRINLGHPIARYIKIFHGADFTVRAIQECIDNSRID